MTPRLLVKVMEMLVALTRAQFAKRADLAIEDLANALLRISRFSANAPDTSVRSPNGDG